MIGTVLGNRYEIISEIGSGGMAKVYKAKCRYLQRIVAIKVLKDEYREDYDFLKRFDTEAQAAASLTHPNIVQIYDVGRDNNRYYIVMEYVDGITLKEYIAKRGSLEWREAVNISIQICSALAKAHSRNIIHRDIKPHNIIMTSDGVPKVADFGIARSVSAETATMKVDTIGSVHYSSPEQARGGYTDAQSDIYSIGVTIFEMITGKLPFDGETPVAVALKHLQEEPPLPSTLKPGIPESLNYIILKAMAKSRQDRYASVNELINDLENLRADSKAFDKIVLPNVKHESNKYDTKKIEKLGDEDLGTKRKSARSEGSGREGSRLVMPFIYLILIATILGSMYYFVRMMLNDLFADPDLPKEITVQNYMGRDIEEVVKELEINGIEPVSVTYETSETVKEGIIIRQSPLPDSKMKIGGLTPLELVVSKGDDLVEIPQIKNEDHNALRFKLEDEYDLIVVEKPEYHPEVGINLAIRSDPEPGTKVKRGSTITIYWSMGPEKKQVVVPDLIGDTYDRALKKLTDRKLKIGQTFPEGREGYQGRIVDQAPKPGETVFEDQTVDIYFEDETQSGGTGDNAPQPVGGNKSVTISLPSGYTFIETVRLRVIIINNSTGEQIVIRDETSVPVTYFPYTQVIPVPDGGGITARIYINDLLVFDQQY